MIRDQYENGECPDCREDIPHAMEDGGECSNCGHVFYDEIVLSHIPSGEPSILSLNISPGENDDELPRSLERFYLDDDTGPEQPYLGEV